MDRIKEMIPAPGAISFEDRAKRAKPYDWGYGCTPRVTRLREECYSKAGVLKDWADVIGGVGVITFRKNVRLDIDRARIITKSFKETEGKPMILRKAEAVARLCEEMPVFIKQGELIVGDPNGAPDEVRWYPEISISYMPDALEAGFKHMVTPEEKKEILEDIYDYWKDKALDGVIANTLPKESLPFILRSPDNPSCFAGQWTSGCQITDYDYEKIFQEGVQARIHRAEEKLAELEGKAFEMSPADYISKKNAWESMIICGKAIIRFAQRHAELAREQAQKEQNPQRKKELEEIAAVCEWVPANPPRTFHEAIQFLWFNDVVGRYLVTPGVGSGTRLDQVWWPYYEKDMKEGRITRAEALELIECWMIKVQEVGAFAGHPQLFTLMSGGEVFYTANVGGSKPDGKDASNDLTCVILEGLVDVRFNHPPVMFRYHRNVNPDVIERVIELIRAGTGHPAIFSEDLMERWALMRGFSLHDAKRTQAAGCVTMSCTGKPLSSAHTAIIGFLAAAKMLEYALYQGQDATRHQEGKSLEPKSIYLSKGGVDLKERPVTKDPREMKSSEELLEATCEQLDFYTKIYAISHNISQQVIMDQSGDPFNSLMLDDCLDLGIDMFKYNKVFDSEPQFAALGFVNIADSLAAIQKLVFDEKKYTMNELLSALKANWKGYEVMRQDFLNVPKFGNDNDYADEWAIKVRTKMWETVRKTKDAWGKPFGMDGSSVIGYQAMSFGIGATPDGRISGHFMADGSCSPAAGADKKGPTAAMNSVAKMPFLHTSLFNQRFMPQDLEGENKKIFAEYLREWYEKKTIPHIQFNVVNTETLRDAQQHPENYSDLQVRIAGYSAYFIDIPKETQDSIILRTAHSF
ncbi:MAG: pyruvate formate lyase family protein [Sterolibacterium sp.]